MIKRCLFCGRYFTPDRRVGKRQKACQGHECKRARKQLAQTNWCSRNPGYFRGRYWYVKDWRKRHKQTTPLSGKEMIQDKIHSSKLVFKLILLIPAGIKTGMIQDEILLRRLGRRTFVATGYV